MNLLRKRHAEEWTVGVILLNKSFHFLHHFGMSSSHVVVFMQIVGKVIEVYLAAIDNHLPVAHAHTEHIGFVEFPIKMVVFFLRSLARQRGIDGNTIKPVVFQTWVAIALLIVFDACQVAECCHQVVEGKLVVVDDTGSHLSRPANDEGESDTAFVGATLQAAEFCITIEESGVCPALFVRTIIGGENHNGVFRQAFFFEFLHDFAHLHIQATDHGSKLRVSNVRRIVARTFVAAVLTLCAEMSLIGFEDGVLGLNQLSVRKRVGKDAQEGFVLALLVEPVESVLMNKVGRILLAVDIVVAKHGVLDVLIQNNAFHGLVARRTAVGIEEVGIVEMCLKLADVAIKLINAALIGRRNRTFVAASHLPNIPVV